MLFQRMPLRLHTMARGQVARSMIASRHFAQSARLLASAQQQSEATRQQNFEQTADQIAQKINTNPESITTSDAQSIHRAEARATGQQYPPKGSITAETQHLAAENEGATKNSGVSSGSGAGSNANSSGASPQVQSQVDRKENFEEVASDVADKLANDPASITKEDANKAHSREVKATGRAEKGGIASQAHQQVNQNEQ